MLLLLFHRLLVVGWLVDAGWARELLSGTTTRDARREPTKQLHNFLHRLRHLVVFSSARRTISTVLVQDEHT